ncbi:MAG: hypothetical protein ACOZBZ_01765 [Patescibacteria group bacterium]
MPVAEVVTAGCQPAVPVLTPELWWWLTPTLVADIVIMIISSIGTTLMLITPPGL